MTRLRTLYVAEPSGQYLTRPPLVVDCSLLAAVLFNEPASTEAQQQLSGHALHAPTLMHDEMAQVAVTNVRRGMPAQAALDVLADYRAQAIEFHDTDLLGQLEFSLRYGLSAYDAAYLWLAAELKAPLATFDRKLNDAAQAHFNDAR